MTSPFSINAEKITSHGDRCTLTYERLHIPAILASVSASEAGAIASFVGQTRNNFRGKYICIFGTACLNIKVHQGKVVTQLEYQVCSRTHSHKSMVHENSGLLSSCDQDNV